MLRWSLREDGIGAVGVVCTEVTCGCGAVLAHDPFTFSTLYGLLNLDGKITAVADDDLCSNRAFYALLHPAKSD